MWRSGKTRLVCLYLDRQVILSMVQFGLLTSLGVGHRIGEFSNVSESMHVTSETIERNYNSS